MTQEQLIARLAEVGRSGHVADTLVRQFLRANDPAHPPYVSYEQIRAVLDSLPPQ